jgi:C-terminal processing protease CtpA/Prc
MEYYSLNAGDGLKSKSTFTSENTTEGDYEWFILTSPVTYSAANLFASMARDMGLATIIGQQSSGGAASVKIMIMPNGTVIRISSPNIIANSNFESIEFGIPVDIAIPLDILSDDDQNLDAILDAIR